MTRTLQLRLNDPELIRKRVNEFIGKKINIVLKDNRVTIGELIRVQESGITIRNMRLKDIPLSFHEIAEIYFDKAI